MSESPIRATTPINAEGIRALAGEKLIRPVLAGTCKPRLGRPPKIVNPIDIDYQTLQREMCRVARFVLSEFLPTIN